MERERASRWGQERGGGCAQVPLAEEAVGSAMAICGPDRVGVDGVDSIGIYIGIDCGHRERERERE